MSVIETAAKYSKASTLRLAAFKQALKHLDGLKIEGDVVECGVWKAGHIVMARMVSPERVCWLYDTFDGMTEPTEHDVTRSGITAIDKMQQKARKGKKWNAVSLNQVRDILQKEKVFDADKIKFVVGDVCNSLKVASAIPDKIALLRLDTDWYDSTKMEMEVLYPKLVSGGYLIVDDYGHWAGSRKAVADYLGEANQLTAIDYTGYWMRKP